MAAASGLSPTEYRALPIPHRVLLRNLFLSRQAGPGLWASISFQLYQLLLGLSSFARGPKPEPKSFEEMLPDLSYMSPSRGTDEFDELWENLYGRDNSHGSAERE